MKISGEGTIEKRGKGSYRIRFNLGIDKRSGKALYSPWRTIKGNKADALAARERYRQELTNGINLDADTMTFSTYAGRWADNRRDMGMLSPSSLRLDKQMIAILNDHIGDMILSEINAISIETMLATHSREKRAHLTSCTVCIQSSNRYLRMQLTRTTYCGIPAIRSKRPRCPGLNCGICLLQRSKGSWRH